MKKLFGFIFIAFNLFSCGNSQSDAVEVAQVNNKISKFTTEFDSIFVSNYDRAVLTVLADSILKNIEVIRNANNQYDSLPNLYFIGGEVAMKVFKGEEALKFFNYLIDEFPTHEQADKAMYFVAYTYENVIQDSQKAIEMYKKLYKEKPNSDWGENAKSQVMFLESQTPLFEDLEENKDDEL